jgi:hypothetical protein
MTLDLTAAAGPLDVRLRATGSVPGAARIEVLRTMLGTRSVVRAWPGFDGAWVHTDIDVLQGTPLTYEAVLYDASGAILATTPPTAAVAVPPSGAVLRDALVPAHRVPVRLAGQTSGDTTSDVRREVLRPLGRSAPLAITDVRQRATGTTSVLTLTRTEHDQLRSLLDSGNVLLFTGPVGFDIARPFYLTAGALTVSRVSAALDEARLFTYDWMEVDGPPVLEPTPAVTWGQLLDTGTRWADIRRTPWVDVMFPPAAPARLRSA